MQESNHDEEEERNKAEAGIARGAARSMGLSAARLPAVGRLPAVPRPMVVRIPRPPAPRVVMPKSAPRVAMPRRLPVKQVAKVSDRVSQGLDLYDLAAESSAKESNLSKLRSFASSK
jgi:hypothetical protein